MFYDDLLRLQLLEGPSLVGFANDVGLLVVNHTMEGLKAVTNGALSQVNACISGHSLELAHAKTEAVMLTVKWAYP